MKTAINGELAGTIDLIKETERLIKMWEKHLPDPAAISEIWQLEDLKKGFIKELLAHLVQSDLNVSDLEPFLQNATSYLKKFDRAQGLPSDLKATLEEVERTLTPRNLHPAA